MSTGRIRRAAQADADGILAVKHALALPPGTREAPRGGFLLGSSLEHYRALIGGADVWVLEDADGCIAGFVVLLPDAVLRASELWAHRDAIRWHAPEGWTAPEERVCYLDQLAVLPHARVHAGALALTALGGAVDAGHEHLFATTVAHPIRNTAALPLLRALGAVHVGSLDEAYEGVGRIVSHLYHAPLAGARERVAATRGGRRAWRTLAHGAGAG